MPKAMFKEDWLARAHAYDECAEHMGMDWSDGSPAETKREVEQGKIVAEKLRNEAEKCRRIAEGAYSPALRT